MYVCKSAHAHTKKISTYCGVVWDASRLLVLIVAAVVAVAATAAAPVARGVVGACCDGYFAAGRSYTLSLSCVAYVCMYVHTHIRIYT